MNSPIRISAIGFLQHLQFLYLPSELDITKYTKRVYPTFDCNQTPDPVIPTLVLEFENKYFWFLFSNYFSNHLE
jgi:hypothetical protein